MANLLKQRKNELLNEAFAKEPALRRGKRICGIVSLIWVIVRALDVAVELWLALTVDSAFFIPSNLFALFVVALFAKGLHDGQKACAILPIIGGAIMLLQVFSNGIYQMLGSEYILEAKIYALAFIFASVVQILLPMFLLVTGDCKRYFAIVTEITGKMSKKQ